MDAPIKPAEHISHELAKSTFKAISWTGGVQAFLAAVTLLWTFWRFYSDRKEKEKKKKKKEEKDEKRRNLADEEDGKRRGNADRGTRRDGRGRKKQQRRG